MMLNENESAGAYGWPLYQNGRGVPVPAQNEIHLWRAPLDIGPEKLRGLEAFLQPDESERAARFRFPGHRARYIVARGTLRSILGIHLGRDPRSLRFAYGPHGKPALAEPAGTRIEFNLSHSAGLAVYAVALERRVGVDVERVKPEGSWLQIARQYFKPSEAAELAALPEEAMRKRFFEMWSVKEARLKALGEGLKFPLDKDVDAAAWPVAGFVPMPGYCAALAYEARPAEPAVIRHHFAA